MPVRAQTIVWQRPDGPKSVVVAGASWLIARLPAILPAGELRGYVASEPDAAVVERGSLTSVADELLLAAAVVILIDPEDREGW